MTQPPPPPPTPGPPDVPDFAPPPQWTPPPLVGPPPNPALSAPIASVQPPRRRRVAVIVIAALVIVGMAAAAIWITPRLFVPATGSPPAPISSEQPQVVTVTPVPQPTTETVLTSGGGLGRRVDFRTASGTGTISITRASWSQAGLMAPPEGDQYLVITATVTCRSGTVAVSSLRFIAKTDPAVGTGFGPTLDDPLPGVTLTPGQQTSGEVGFVIPADTTDIAFLADNHRTAAKIEVPGP